MGKNDVVTYLSVPNWDKYQEKRTNPNTGEPMRLSWVKLHINSLDDYAYTLLSLRQRGLLMELWKLAGKTENRIPNDDRWLKNALQTKEAIVSDINTLISSGFLAKHGSSYGPSYPPYAQIREEEIREDNGEANASSTVREVFDYFIEKRNRNPKRTRLTDKRRKVITARLKDFSVEECKQAIAGVEKDPWPERRDHDDLTIVFRPENFEKFLALSDDVAAMSTAERQARHLQSLKERGVA